MAKAFEDNVYKMTVKEKTENLGSVVAAPGVTIDVTTYAVNKVLVIAVNDEQQTTLVASHRGSVVHRIFYKKIAKNWMNRRLEEFVNDLVAVAAPKKRKAA